MRLLHVVPTYFPAARYGGPIYSVHALCTALTKRGHEVHVYTTNVDGSGVSSVSLCTPVELDGVRVWYFPTGLGRRVYRSPKMGISLDRNTKFFDIVHLHSTFLWPTTAAAAAARRARIPYVMSPRGMLVHDLIMRKNHLLKTAWITAFERRNLTHAAAVHATSDVEADEIRKLDLRTSRIAVVPNGVELPPGFRHASDASPPFGLTQPFVLSLGRINWKKGLDRLIQAMALVPSSHLVIAGNDEEGYQVQLEALAREHGISERTRFLGPVFGPDKWKLLAAADLFVMPSYSENFGNAALEAMASGVPVVVTPQVGLANAVVEAAAGVVVPGEPQAIASTIKDLLSDSRRRRRMGEAARLAATERFSWDAIVRSMETVYLEAVAHSRRRM